MFRRRAFPDVSASSLRGSFLCAFGIIHPFLRPHFLRPEVLIFRREVAKLCGTPQFATILWRRKLQKNPKISLERCHFPFFQMRNLFLWIQKEEKISSTKSKTQTEQFAVISNSERKLIREVVAAVAAVLRKLHKQSLLPREIYLGKRTQRAAKLLGFPGKLC